MSCVEGSLSKWTNVVKGWQYRWVVLDSAAGTLSYYTSKEKMLKGVRRGCVRLYRAEVTSNNHFTFSISVDGKVFHFQAKNEEDREEWVKHIETTIMKISFAEKVNQISGQSKYTMEDFDKKLSEADAYLQLVIDQTKTVEGKKDALQQPDDKNRCDEICNHANCTLEQVKHTIVLLQIAKNAAHPIFSVYQPVVPDDGAENMVGASLMFPESVLLPGLSYSSSEDDDFFDACSSHSIIITNCPDPPEMNPKDDSGSSKEGKPNTVRIAASKQASDEDFDLYYNVPNEPGITVEGSVVRHLLSQVKIGMDLTKVTLPTFCLERRSLLEMYADHFAHADLFVEIARKKTPRERMVACAKWYLSSFYAGRKGGLVKKPYNPILGEVFKCGFSVDKKNLGATVVGGPVQGVCSNQVSFLAEQVSHHPPISAFYAEHVGERITCTAHIWTKSKFLGLSVGVQNVGRAVVSVLNYNEAYIMGFPSGYGRSILTVPWLELGGDVQITCEETGFRADIVFLTKPFYGGKKHRINCDIFEPGHTTPTMTVLGEWNGEMKATCNGKTEVFVNAETLPTSPKVVRPVMQQEANESRFIWRHVTAAIFHDDLTKATDTKFELENTQRIKAQERQELGIEWEPQHFDRDSDQSDCNWRYKHSLINRLRT